MKAIYNSRLRTILFPIYIFLLCFFAFYYQHLSILREYCQAPAKYAFMVCLFVFPPVLFFTAVSVRSNGMRLLFANCIWIILSQAMCNNLGFATSRATFFSFLYCLFYAGGVAFDGRQKKLLLKVFACFVCTMILLWAAGGIYTAFTGRQITDRIRYSVEGTQNGLLCYIKFFNFHRNTSAAFFVIALGLAAYLWLNSKNRIFRTATLLASAAYYVCIALQHSRSNYLSAAVCIALWIAAGVSSHLRRNGFVGKVLLSGCVIVCTVLIYASFSPMSNLIAELAANFDGGSPTQTQQVAVEVPEENQSVQGVLVDERKLSEDAGTLNGRTEIWKAVIPAVREKPSILLFGSAEGSEMNVVNGYLENKVSHMHNTLMQQLMLAGLPGFLLYAAFFVLLLVRMLKVFFSPTSEETIGSKSLLGLLAAVMVCGIFETTLNRPMLPAFSFFLFAGALFGGDPPKNKIKSSPIKC